MSTAKVGLCLWGFGKHTFHVEEFLVHSQSLRQLSPAKKGLLLTVGHQKPTWEALVQRRGRCLTCLGQHRLLDK